MNKKKIRFCECQLCKRSFRSGITRRILENEYNEWNGVSLPFITNNFGLLADDEYRDNIKIAIKSSSPLRGS